MAVWCPGAPRHQNAEPFNSLACFSPRCFWNTRIPPCRLDGDGAVATPQVACGARHTLALTQRGAAFAAGWNRFGQLGVGARDRASRRTPTRVAGPWNPRGAEHAAERACAASASARGTHPTAQEWAGAGGGRDAGPVGRACEDESRDGRVHRADAAGCGADPEDPPDVECRDNQGQAEAERASVDLDRGAETGHELLGGSAGGKLQEARVLDVVCGWWHSLFIVEFV